MQATARAFSVTGPERGSERRPVPRGVVLGHSLNLEPPPPAADVLAAPLTLSHPPAYDLPRDTLAIRLSAVLGNLGLGSRDKELNLMWRAQTATAILMAAVSPKVARGLAASGWLLRHSAAGRFRVGPITHPYDMLDVARTAAELPDSLIKERRFLEDALALVLRRYVEEVSGTTGAPFSFAAEAREYFLRSARRERALKSETGRDARMDLLQEVHDGYYHARNYYMFSVLAREAAAGDGKLFMMHCHAAHSVARMDWDGTVREAPVGRRLPTRREVAFLVRRDRALRARCAADPAVLAQVKALLATFRA